MLREATGNLARLRHITRVVAKYGYGELIQKSPGALGLDAEVPKNTERLTERPTSPRRFRLLLEELGPTFIKFGQVLSARPDLVPERYVVELKTLQNQCEPLPFEEIERAIAEGLGRQPGEIFEFIDPKPLATASVAQVHRGRTRAGEDVVIKVQRPHIAEEIRADIDILYRLAQVLDSIVEESSMAEPVAVVREFERGLNEELDFRTEAMNLREFADLHRPRTDIVIPTVYSDLSSATVLTMSFLEGTPFTNLPPTADKKAIAERIVREAFDEVFVDGVFHADPHPGNLMLLSDGRYAILDLGLLGRLTHEMRETLVVIVLAVAVRDADTLARALYRLGQRDARIDISALKADVLAVFERYLNRSIKDVDSKRLIQDILTLAMKHKIRVPPEYAMLGRASATIEGIVRELHPDLDVARVATPYAEKLLLGRVAPDNVSGGIYRALLQFQGMSQDVPLQMSQILSDLSSGNFTVNVSGQLVQKLGSTLLVAATMITGAILAGAFVIGTFIALAVGSHRHILALFGGLSAVAIMAWLGTYAVVRPRLRKFSLTRYLLARRARRRR